MSIDVSADPVQVVARDRAQRPTVTPTEPDFGAARRAASRRFCMPLPHVVLLLFDANANITTLGDVEIADNGLRTFEYARRGGCE